MSCPISLDQFALFVNLNAARALGRQRENMTLAAEKALPVRFAKAAGAGEMLRVCPETLVTADCRVF